MRNDTSCRDINSESAAFSSGDPNIIIAQHAGFCFGVKRAVDLMNEEIAKGNNIYSIGELIHNRVFNEDLKKKGVRFITRQSLSGELDDGATVFIRAHGERRDVLDNLAHTTLKVVDATCPYVVKIHKIVRENSSERSLTIIAGDSEHPEVEGIMSNAAGDCVCFCDIATLKQFLETYDKKHEKVIAVAQTTFNINIWKEFCVLLAAEIPDINIFDTICAVTEKRQTETAEIAKASDFTIVVGSQNSSNTKKLYEIANEYCKEAILIETAADLKNYPPEALRDKKLGVTAGASTPHSIIQEVIYTMTDIINEELSFAEMLDSTFKTLNQGERVTGVISAVSPAEIHVDLGIKHTGILPYDEITEDSSVDLVKEYKPGDTIEAIVVKFNDSEGTVLLSKKRIDSMKHWDKISEVLESGEIINAKVKEAVKGGYIVLYDAIRIFVPASQSGVPMNGDVNSIVGKTMPCRIIEVNKQKKRVIGSIKQASRSISKQLREEFFETAQVGQKFTGTIRSIVPYGVFVDLGGVDGMVHISQLTWTRIKEPSEVVKVGQQLDVFIREIDTEKRRISLGCKLDEDNPWAKFEEQFKVGDVVEVKIVNLFPFGAFAEVIPGVDGLIHISQAANRQLKSVSEVFKIGDVVSAKITAIKSEAHKISLSVRALLESNTEDFVVQAEVETEVEAEVEADVETEVEAAVEAAVEGDINESAE